MDISRRRNQKYDFEIERMKGDRSKSSNFLDGTFKIYIIIILLQNTDCSTVHVDARRRLFLPWDKKLSDVENSIDDLLERALIRH